MHFQTRRRALRSWTGERGGVAMASVMPFDELNAFKEALPIHFENGRIRSKQDCDDIIDELFDLFLLSLANGVDSVNEQFNTDISLSIDDVDRIINTKIDGETWKDRVWKWYETGGTEADIVRIAETESHRDANQGAFDAATRAGAKTKTWHCMMLPTSRDTHVYLDGVTTPMDGEFYSFKGGSTQFPGQWGIAEEDINCLCWLTFS